MERERSDDQPSNNEQIDASERVELVLQRLKALKTRVFELRLQCEKYRKPQLARRNRGHVHARGKSRKVRQKHSRARNNRASEILLSSSSRRVTRKPRL